MPPEATPAASTTPASPIQPSSAAIAEEARTVRVKAHDRALRVKEKIATEDRAEPAEEAPKKAEAREPES